MTRGIKDSQIEALYRIVKYDHSDPKKLKDGVKHLVKKTGMSEANARFYINFFVKLKKGECHKSGTGPSGHALRCFFNKTLTDCGDDSLKIALESLWSYIEYYENKSGVSIPGFRAIHEEFSEKLK